MKIGEGGRALFGESAHNAREFLCRRKGDFEVGNGRVLCDERVEAC